MRDKRKFTDSDSGPASLGDNLGVCVYSYVHTNEEPTHEPTLSRR